MVLHTVREIVRGIDDLASRSASLTDSASLYEAGLSSYGTIELMMALEAAFGVEFPDALLTRETFGTIASLAAAVAALSRTRSPDRAHPAAGTTTDAMSIDALLAAAGAER